MHINLILIPFVIILGLLFSLKDTIKNRGWYITICSIVFLLIASLRNPKWMTKYYHIDTLNYKNLFESSFNMDWSEFQRLFYLRYVVGVDEYDVGFVALNKFISLFTHEFWIYSFIVDLIFFIPFGIILYRYCNKIWQIMFAFIFYISLVQVFFLGGARQMFSLGFDLMALLAIIERKHILSFVCIFIGITIHFSSLLFIIPILAIRFGMKPVLLKIFHALCFIVFPIVLMFPNEMIRIMGSTVGMEKYVKYGTGDIQGGSETFIFLIETLSLFCLLAIRRKDLKEDENVRNIYVMAPLLTFFAPLIISNGTMIRISLYFHLFLAILVPYAIDCVLDKRDRGLVYAAAISVLSLLTLVGGGMRYYFFWQV